MKVATAGAYVWVNGLIPFVVGPASFGKSLVVIRLGGHVERGETPWECTAREASEEARLQIEPVVPPATFLTADATSPLRAVEWHEVPQPLLVITQGQRTTVMFLARSSGVPAPAAEVKGLLLLRPSDVTALCRESLTLAQYLTMGGRAVLREPLDEGLPLEPFPQLRLLGRILDEVGPLW